MAPSGRSAMKSSAALHSRSCSRSHPSTLPLVHAPPGGCEEGGLGLDDGVWSWHPRRKQMQGQGRRQKERRRDSDTETQRCRDTEVGGGGQRDR
eukprot:1317104-Rhodomonas_salina.2